MRSLEQKQPWSKAGMINGTRAILSLNGKEFEYKCRVKFCAPPSLSDDVLDNLQRIDKLPMAKNRMCPLDWMCAHTPLIMHWLDTGSFLGTTVAMLKDPLGFLLANADMVGGQYGMFLVPSPSAKSVGTLAHYALCLACLN
jgi:hypothetical protein